MQYIHWSHSEGRWKGHCPRCASHSFFEQKSTVNTPENKVAETLYCPGGHVVLVEYKIGDPRKAVLICSPVDHDNSVPGWLPELYRGVYRELLSVRANGFKRSVVSMCSILLEAHVNELIKNPGEKKKTLFERLEILQKQGLIDKDQFSSATVTRITRNGVLHPDQIVEDLNDAEDETVFEEITGFFERSYRWRSSKALPSPDAQEIKFDEVK